MIVHFANNFKMICDKEKDRRGGVLLSRYRKWYRRGVDQGDVKWLFTTSDEQVTCPECIKVRIAFHEEWIRKLREKNEHAPHSPPAG